MSSLQQRFIEKWVGYLTDSDREMVLIAVQKLGSTKNAAVVPEIVKVLYNRPEDVRTAAARALGEIGDPSAIPELIKLLNDSNVILAAAAAESLGTIGHPKAVPALVKILKDYKIGLSRHRQLHGYDRGLYMAAVHALQIINTRDARRALNEYHRS